MDRQIYRGEIYYIWSTENCTGCEQHGGRPGIIVSNDINNQHSQTIEVVFLTTKKKKNLPTHVPIRSARYPSTALCEQISTVDKMRVGEYVGIVTAEELNSVNRAMKISLGI